MVRTEFTVGSLQLFATLGSNLDENIGKHSRWFVRVGFQNQCQSLAFGSEWVLGAQPVIRSFFLMLKNGIKLKYYANNEAQVRRGEGSVEVQPKAQVWHFFWKCNNCEYQTPYKVNYRRHVKNKYSNYKAPTQQPSVPTLDSVQAMNHWGHFPIVVWES